MTTASPRRFLAHLYQDGPHNPFPGIKALERRLGHALPYQYGSNEGLDMPHHMLGGALGTALALFPGRRRRGTEPVSAPVVRFQQEHGVVAGFSLEIAQKRAQPVVVIHHIIEFQTVPFLEIMVSFPLQNEYVSRRYRIVDAVDPVSSVAFGDYYQFGKVVIVVDISQIPFMLGCFIAADPDYIDRVFVFLEKIPTECFYRFHIIAFMFWNIMLLICHIVKV